MFVLLKAHFNSYVHVRPASIGRVENCRSNLNIIIQTWLLVWIRVWITENLNIYDIFLVSTVIVSYTRLSSIVGKSVLAFSWMHFITYNVTTCTTALSLEGKQ